MLNPSAYALGANRSCIRDLFEYGCRVSRAWDVPRLARPYLEQLTAQVNVSAVLSIREGDRVMTLDQVEGHGSLRVVSEVGGRLPLHCTSQGKVFLAALAESEAQALLGRRPLTAYTPHTVTDAAQLLASLEQVRRQAQPGLRALAPQPSSAQEHFRSFPRFYSPEAVSEHELSQEFRELQIHSFQMACHI